MLIVTVDIAQHMLNFSQSEWVRLEINGVQKLILSKPVKIPVQFVVVLNALPLVSANTAYSTFALNLLNLFCILLLEQLIFLKTRRP